MQCLSTLPCSPQQQEQQLQSFIILQANKLMQKYFHLQVVN